MATVQPAPPISPLAPPRRDVTGRNRLAWNVAASWAGHLVFAVAGFILPRLVNYHLGQVGLGVWDFGWSMVTYVRLAPLGIGSSVNRYVAQYRSAGDVDGLRRAVSSVAFVTTVAATLGAIATLVVAGLVPWFFAHRLGEFTGDAQWVVRLLGLSICFEVASSPFHGVMTGCHRWDLHHGLSAASHMLTVAAMAVGLWLGLGLIGLSAVNLAGTLLTELARAWATFRICPELSLRWRYVGRLEMRTTLTYGLKTFTSHMSLALLQQAVSILIVAHLGPAVLALYARPIALIRLASTIVVRYAHVLVPTVAGLQASGRKRELQALLLEGGRVGGFLAMPMLCGLAIMGGPILRLWMGPAFDQGPLLAVLAVGQMLAMPQEPVRSILAGLNLHGRIAWVIATASASGLAFAVIALGPLAGHLMAAALAVTLPSIILGIYVPIYACRMLEVPLRRYLWRAFGGPILCTLPFAACLVGARLLFPTDPLKALASGVGLGAVVLAPLYWRFAAPPGVRTHIINFLGVGWVGGRQPGPVRRPSVAATAPEGDER
jgi:O-antigen/teichoic acid export membrane protein